MKLHNLQYNRVARLPGPISPWVHKSKKFQPVSEMKRAKDPWDERNLTNKANMSNTNYNFRAYHSFGNPSLVVSLQLNGILMMWKLQRGK